MACTMLLVSQQTQGRGWENYPIEDVNRQG